MRLREQSSVTFSDWREAARNGYVAGGMRPNAAAAIVAAAVDDISPLVTRDLTGELLQTFLCALGIECGRLVRRVGAAAFVTPSTH